MNKRFLIAILFFIPFIGQLVLLPFVNRIEPVIFGLPFFHFWLVLWIVLTPLITFVIYRLEKSGGYE
ncbi:MULTISPECIES: DUF3311 domain-containing protein [Bacillus]|uniref:DUF3311 domain-containing protein n=1 Tax=Bacillus TaxID=1386 RepID=UPI00041468FC|nr:MULTISPECIES: DUF3311 domain-containing protein [Bacillus]QHZ47304.1 DUF3311 domain-containing protein [Bacillus sp. NSP9.1]WFA03365.1 DUF3311 domain-containing protein [Bacillus sp. HSf4]